MKNERNEKGVSFQRLLNDETYMSAAGILPVPFGIDQNGTIVIRDLMTIPHLLICGNDLDERTLFCQELLAAAFLRGNSNPIKLMVCDTNITQYSFLSGKMNFMLPVVSDCRKISVVLTWTVAEAKRRLSLFSEIGTRDITQYNNKQPENRLPHLFVVVDDVDILLDSIKEAAESIHSIINDGRAVGIHLMLVSSAKIERFKNIYLRIPSRVCFYISNNAYMHSLLDEKKIASLQFESHECYLKELGRVIRIQSVQVSDDELRKLCDTLPMRDDASTPSSLKQLLDFFDRKTIETPKESDENSFFDGYDELISQAVDVVLDTKQASASMLQRRLKLGYSMAARLIDQMEELGVVGPFEGSKPRRLLITREQWVEMNGKEKDSFSLMERDVQQDLTGKMDALEEEKTPVPEEKSEDPNKRESLFQKLFGKRKV